MGLGVGREKLSCSLRRGMSKENRQVLRLADDGCFIILRCNDAAANSNPSVWRQQKSAQWSRRTLVGISYVSITVIFYRPKAVVAIIAPPPIPIHGEHAISHSHLRNGFITARFIPFRLCCSDLRISRMSDSYSTNAESPFDRWN